jgi:hypothetical protein
VYFHTLYVFLFQTPAKYLDLLELVSNCATSTLQKYGFVQPQTPESQSEASEASESEETQPSQQKGSKTKKPNKRKKASKKEKPDKKRRTKDRDIEEESVGRAEFMEQLVQAAGEENEQPMPETQPPAPATGQEGQEARSSTVSRGLPSGAVIPRLLRFRDLHKNDKPTIGSVTQKLCE